MASLKVKDIHILSGEILELEDKLSQKRARLNLLLGIVTPSPDPRIRGPRASDGLRGKAVEWINMHPFNDHSIADIASGIDEDQLQVGKALNNACKARQIKSTRRGRYQAIEKEVASEESTS